MRAASLIILLCSIPCLWAASRTTYRTEEGATAGTNVVINGDFSNGTNGWILESGVTIAGGKATWTGNANLRQNVTLDSGSYYEFIYNVSDYTSGAHRAQGFTETAPYRYCPGTIRDIIYFASGSSAIFIAWSDTASGSISNITVRKITSTTVDYNPRRIAITGDSIAQQMSVMFPDTYPGDTATGKGLASSVITPVDCALGNQTFNWVRTNGILQALSTNADTIIIHCGVNDVSTARTWTDVLSDLNAIRGLVTIQDLFIDEILPWTDGTDAQALTIRTWNTNLAVWCATNNAHLISAHDPMGKVRVSTGYLDDLALANDGVHPGTGGMYVLWSLWLSSLESFYGIPLHPSSGTTYYVSSTLGDDTNSGTNSAAPWKSLTNVYNFTHFVGFSSGDSILLKAGDSFDGPLYINQNGISGLPITVDRYGSGSNPIIYGDHPSASWSAVAGHGGIYGALIGSNNISINYVYGTNGNIYTNVGAQGATNFDTWMGAFTTNNWGWSGASNTVYVATPDSNAPTQLRVFELAVIGPNTKNYHTYQNLDIRNSNIGIEPYSCSHVLIQNNQFQDMIGNATYLLKCNHSTVASNTVVNTGNDALYLHEGGSNWMHHNVISNTGITVLNVPASGDKCGIGLQQGTNNIIEHNSLYNVNVAPFDYYYEVNTEVRYNYMFHCGNNVVATHGTGLSVHHNIFNVDGGRGILAAWAYDPAYSGISNNVPQKIYNNVVYNCSYIGLYTSPGSSNIVMRNNIIVSTNGSLARLNDGVDCDYNLYFIMPGTSPSWKWNEVNTYNTLADFQVGSGQDSHSLYIDPQFISTTDFRLQSTSPAKWAGIFVTNELDYAGISMHNPPSMGAYEWVPASEVNILRVGTMRMSQ